MAPSSSPLTLRFHALRDLLSAHEALWRPTPFHHPRPAWVEDQPPLAQRLLALDEDTVDALAGDNQGLISLLADHAPDLDALHDLIRLPSFRSAEEKEYPSRLLANVPGRKQAQITAFAEAVGPVANPMLEWCAGKGHLGRLLAWRQPLPVTSLEIDGVLVEEGVELARRASLAQNFLCADALAGSSVRYLAGHHAVALHACGDLHLAMLRGAVAKRIPALDLAPCCYYRIEANRYQPLCEDAGLDLVRDELHLAVTETVTAGGRDRRRSETAAAWKLAFLEWRATQGLPRERPFKPVPVAWLGLGFTGWMERLCTRESLPQPAAADWLGLEYAGWQRHAEVRRLDLVRLAFRRPLEIWLVLDRAVYLERAGYRVEILEFCPRLTTPRNLLIRARMG